MKVNGEAVLHARAEEVWAALVDPAVLVATIPGCESLELIGGDRYRMSVTAGVASIKGTYAGEVELADQRPPRSFLLRASGSGSPGTVRADVLVGLEPQETGSTRLTYEADAVVGGMVGGVGQRMLASVAKRTAGEFFAAVDAVLRNGGVPAAAPAQAGPALEPGAGGSTPVSGEVYRRPVAAAVPAGSRDPRALLLGVVVGALVALAGVVVGRLTVRGSR
ncbi:MAG: SRPBCC family protein [Actinomycetes bacterium]